MVFAISNNSCSVIRKSKNKSAINFARKHTALIRECAVFAVSVSEEQNINRFTVTDIKDRGMRKKMASLGLNISVSYSDGGNYEIHDSIVTFETTSVSMGVTEIIYDFAYHPRDFPGSGTRESDYYFVKVAERVYYRKRPFPMM